MQRHPQRPRLAAVLFTDIVDSTSVAAEMGDRRWRELVGRHHRTVRRELKRFEGKENDTSGDGFFATFDRPNDAIRCAIAVIEAVRDLGIEIRAGVTFGEVENHDGKAGGLVVNTAARVMSVGGPGEVLVPASVRELIPGAGIAFSDHGVHRLKGLEGDFRLYRVASVDGAEVAAPPEPPEAAERRREIFPVGRRRGPLIAGLAAAAAAVIVGMWILLAGGSEDRPKAAGPLRDAVAQVDVDSGRIGPSISLLGSGGPGSPGIGGVFIDHPIVVGEGGVWLLRPPQLLHVDPQHEEVRSSTILIGVASSETVARGFGAIWVLGGQQTLFKVNPATDEAVPFLVLPAAPGITPSSMAIGDAVWVGVQDGTLIRLDPYTGSRHGEDTGSAIDLIAATRDSVWVANILDGVVSRFDPDTVRRVAVPIELPGSIDQIVAADHYVWILDKELGVVTRIDADSDTIRGSARVGNDPTDMTVGLGSVWVGDRDGSLYRIDETTLARSDIAVGAEVLGVGVDTKTDAVWVYLGDPKTPP